MKTSMQKFPLAEKSIGQDHSCQEDTDLIPTPEEVEESRRLVEEVRLPARRSTEVSPSPQQGKR
jgi:hypothetical protein